MSKNTLVGTNITIKILAEQQKQPLGIKVAHSKRIIKQFYNHVNGKVYVSYSGGKDSTVLLHLVRSIYSDCIAVFSNTTNEYPEIIKYVKKTPDVIWVHPKKTFKQMIKETGFPLVSKKVSRGIWVLRHPTENNKATRKLCLTGINQKGTYNQNSKLPEKWKFLTNTDHIKFETTNKCCDVLKHEPIERFERENKLRPFIGTMAYESSGRAENYQMYGCNIFSNGKEKSRPLSIWTEQDIWDYAKINDIKFCELYYDAISKNGKYIQAEDRTGCMACGFGYHLEKSDLFNQDRFDRLKLRRPKLYENYMNLTNGGVTFREALSIVKNAKKRI